MGTIRLAVWNMEWLNRLFTGGGDSTFKADDDRPDSRSRETVGERKAKLAQGLAALDAEIVVVVEGPNETAELQLLFDDLAPGDWTCFAQRSLSPNGPDRTDVFSSAQCVGLALRTDRGAFADPPMTVFDAMDPASGAVHEASEPFFFDTGRDKVPEWYRFERRPAYAEVTLADGGRFRVMGLHLKSKGIFSAYEWSRWWAMADANRERLLAQCRRLREGFLDPYLRDPETADIPLVVCGDINDGPGFDTSEMRLKASGIETLMGSVWKPELALGNAIFDTLPERDRDRLDFDDLSTTSFADPIFEGTYHRVWIDHILYTRNAAAGWVSGGEIVRDFGGDPPLRYWEVSDHAPVVAEATVGAAPVD
jgi:endonuclease/exonuclease/phosphatase family metal-dependent hydrolase